MPDPTLDRLQGVIALAARRRADLDATSRRVDSLKQEVGRLEDRVEILTHTANLLRLLFDRVIQDETRFTTETVTSGLRAVFHDQTLSLLSDFSVRAGKVGVDLTLARDMPDGRRIEGDPLSLFGGGPVALISALLRVVVLLKSGRAPFLLLDETVGTVSDEYLESCADFFRQLSERLGVDILLVIHKPGYHDYSHVSYLGTEVQRDGQTEFKATRVAK